MTDKPGLIPAVGLYELDASNRERLLSSVPLMREWAQSACTAKAVGGMEEWAKVQRAQTQKSASTCDWYHGTWQLLRLLNMVAVPYWYEFYHDALRTVLLDKPRANVLISAAADYGMLSTLHEAIVAAGASPTITVCDICATPLLACEWYADRNGVDITCLRENLLSTPELPLGSFDLIVTDEFLTVLKDADKPVITERWRQLLKPDGVVVTTAMIGSPTTPVLRHSYADRARAQLDENLDLFREAGESRDQIAARFDAFAAYHTRHMVTDEGQIQSLFAGFDLLFTETLTPGECVNPTSSLQIIASRG